MSKVIFDISMSLDGFIAGPNVSRQHPMGEGGLRLHDWLFVDQTDADTAVLKKLVETSGAVVLGSRTYNFAINDAWGGTSPFQSPAFVVASGGPQDGVKREGFTFVPQGIESALDQAKKTAGKKNVWIMGGANVAKQFIDYGLLDEIHIHLVPVLLKAGVSMFDHLNAKRVELKNIQTIVSPAVTHLQYAVVK
jgi:dihydrofolate reductase